MGDHAARLPPDQGGESGADELGMGIHGGLDETSLMLYLAPETVDMSAATRNVPDVLAANDILMDAFYTDVRPALEALLRHHPPAGAGRENGLHADTVDTGDIEDLVVHFLQRGALLYQQVGQLQVTSTRSQGQR